MGKIYFTLTGTKYYYGKDFLEKKMQVKLVKEPENEYDRLPEPDGKTSGSDTLFTV